MDEREGVGMCVWEKERKRKIRWSLLLREIWVWIFHFDRVSGGEWRAWGWRGEGKRLGGIILKKNGKRLKKRVKKLVKQRSGNICIEVPVSESYYRSLNLKFL